MTYAGELAAFGAVLCWTLSTQMIEAASHRVGAIAVNVLRLAIALIALTVWVAISSGSIIAEGFTVDQFAWLVASGFIGLFLGDICLYYAFVEIGPRLSMLIMSLASPLTALLGWLFLNEEYAAMQWAGVFITVAGVAWVIMERGPKHHAARIAEPGKSRHIRRVTRKGLLLATGAVLGQAIGFVMAKQGMGDNDPFAATQVRFAAAAIAFIPLLTVMGNWHRIAQAAINPSAISYIAGAAVLGSALGIGLSLAAVKYTSMGVAATILATVPLFLIPFAIFLHREHVGWRAGLGVLIAIAGISMLVT